MSMRRRFARLFGPDPERDVDDEIAFHLEMRIRERIAAGEEPERAREQIMARFGDVGAAREECIVINERRERSMRRASYASELMQDIGYALRSLRRQPAFTALAVITLALGIGANSAIFSVVHAVLLNALPYADADRLMVVETEYSNGESYPLSAPDFMSVREETRVFDDVAAVTTTAMTLTGRGDPEELDATAVSKGVFDLLGIAPLAGRTFSDEEHVPGATDRVILTQTLAERLFGSARASLEQTLVLSGRPYTVVAVTPAGTEAPERTQLYVPIGYDDTWSAATGTARRSEYLFVIGRMRDGATPEMVEQDVRRIGASLAERFPDSNQDVTLTSIPLRQVLLGEVRTPLLILLGAVGLLLLVACANVANLLLARITAREGEIAVRAALGAGRARLTRQLLTESFVLASVGALGGLLLGWWGTRALIDATPVDIPRLATAGVNGPVVAFTAVLAVLTALLFGGLPALQATGGRMMLALRESGRGALSSVRGRRIRAALIIAELALAVMLLIGAGLLIRSFLGLTRVDAGFDMSNAVAFRVSLQGPRYDDPAMRVQFFNELEQRLRALPGVTHVGAASGLPMTGNAALLGRFQVEGMDVPANLLPEIRVIAVTPGYFAALGAPLLMGRQLDERDGSDAPLVALFNRATMARWFGGENPVGRRVVLGTRPWEVAGIVGDMLQGAPGAPVMPEMYMPHPQRNLRTMRFVVRGEGDVLALAPHIRAEVHFLDPLLPVESIDPLQHVFADAVARPRFYTMLLTTFAGAALVLASVGIFGVMSYLVAQRSHEISVRMALGAERSSVIALVVASAMKVAAAGLVIGVAGAVAITGVLRSQLFGVGPSDPVTIGGVLIVLATSALAASLVPAIRAARTDPGAALRDGRA